MLARKAFILLLITVFWTASCEASVFDVCNATIISRDASLVVNASNGAVLHAHNADEARYPASLTKLMTLYLTFDALQQGKIKLHQRIVVSREASIQEPTVLGLKPRETLSVLEAIQATAIKSANDASYALAEAVGGSAQAFVAAMNRKARALKMHNTNFANPNGLHHTMQYTTAYDIAKLAVALQRNHKRYYHIFSMRSFKFRDRIIHGHNRVLQQFPGTNGLKTGFTRASGFNIVTSTERTDGKFIGVALGYNTRIERDRQIMRLLQHAHFMQSTRSIAKHNKLSPGVKVASTQAVSIFDVAG